MEMLGTPVATENHEKYWRDSKEDIGNQENLGNSDRTCWSIRNSFQSHLPPCSILEAKILSMLSSGFVLSISKPLLLESCWELGWVGQTF